MTDELGFEHRFVRVEEEVKLHVVQAGVDEYCDGHGRPVVVLLHGFPECWWTWRHPMRALADAGYHVVTPDMRGYNLSDQPRRTRDYALERLVDDVAVLIRSTGASRAHVVGHDWGGLVAWAFAMRHPEMLNRLAILNMPHPARMQRGLATAAQMKKSWYVFFFQLPRLPERAVARDDFAYLRRAFGVDGLSQEAIERYVEAASRTGLHGAICYYRAAMRALVTGRTAAIRRIDAPTLVLWGERDRYLGRELATPPPEHVPNARVVWFPQGTHWTVDESPDRVSAELRAFLPKPGA